MRTVIVLFAVGGLGLVGVAPTMGSEISPKLTIAKSTAPVGEDVPYTITVKPTAKAKGKRVRIQVKGFTTWRSFDNFRLPKSGTIKDDVEGYQPGTGRYRLLVVNPTTGRVIAKSPVVSVIWTSRVP